MTLSRNFIKAGVLLISLLYGVCGRAQVGDSLPRRHWALPHHAKLHFAGGIGFVAIGAGYSNRKGKLEGDLFYGYLPRSIGGVTIHTLTAKGSWWPLKPVPLSRYEWKPFTTGLLINYTFGKQYFAFSPRSYSFNYYKYPTALHAGLHLGTGLQTKTKGKGLIKGWGLLAELVTYDVEVASYAVNSGSLRLPDIVGLGFGLQARF